MIISRTPFRISFAGGGSDLKSFYEHEVGAVLSVTIDKYIYLSMHPLFNKKSFFLKYSSNEYVDNVKQIKHRIIKEVFSDYKLEGIDFNSSSDIPSGTGLASSSAFTVGLVNLCNAYTSKYLSKEEIAKYACEIEINRLGEPIGKQDQFACSLGGMNFLEFYGNETVAVEKVHLSANNYNSLSESLLLFYTHNVRPSGVILSKQNAAMKSDKRIFNQVKKIVSLAYHLKKELLDGQITDFGKILHEGWELKRELTSNVSSSDLDDIYKLALSNGAEGGKLLGAGGGGFFLFFVKPENQTRLRKAFSKLYELEFSFENSGTTIIY